MADNRQLNEMELLFFDTFSHENAEELNLDLVQFPRPVVIGEVRVIPLQTRVQADVPGGVRLGATNPSNFKLELFVNNLSKPNASTFEKLGLLDYKANDEIQMMTEVQIPTDGLILKGWYNTLTIAIYGFLTSVTVEPEALPPPPPPQPRKQVSPAQPVPVSTPLTVVVKTESRDVKAEPRDWESTQPVVATPHTTQHPLDYIQQQLKQANLQPAGTMTVTSAHPGPHPMTMVPQAVPTAGPIPPVPIAPGQIPLGVAPPIQDYPRPDDFGRHPGDTDRFSPGARPASHDRDIGEPKDHYDREQYDDTRSRDSWGFHDNRDRRDRLDRDYQQSREGSRDREGREFGREGRDYRSRDDRDWDRDKLRDRDRETRGSRERLNEYERDSKDRSYDDRGRSYDDRRDREFDQEQGYDRNRDTELERDRDRGREYDREYDRGREGYRDQDRGRERDVDRGSEREADRPGDWERDRPRDIDRGHDIERIPRDLRDRGGFRDRTREDYREKERSREVYMETEAPRSPSRSRSRSFSGDRFSSRSRSPTPVKPVVVETPQPIAPIVRPRRQESPSREMNRMKEILPEQPSSPSPELEQDEQEMQPFEPMSPEVAGSPMEQAYMSDGDYEAISSDDEFIDIDADVGIDYEMDEEAYGYITAPFNPYQFEMSPLNTFSDVSLTPFELEKEKLLAPDYIKPEKLPKEAQQLLDIVEKYKDENHHEGWVESMESVPGLLPKGLSYLLYKESNSEVLPYLLEWMIEGLDESKAMAQPESAYKVRHLKMGFKLAGSLCSCDSNVAIQCLSRDVQEKLLDTFQSQYMSFSLKLQIISGLDQTIRLQDGIQWFLGVHKVQKMKQEPGRNAGFSSYQRAVKFLLQKQVVRVIVALTTLIKKVHLYEVMSKLSLQLDSVVESLATSGTKSEESQMDMDIETMSSSLSESDIEAVISCVDEITKVYTLAPTLIAQPGRTLPGKKMVEVKVSPEDPYPAFYHIANSCHLLESIFVLVSSPATSCVPTLFGSVRSLLQKMTESQHGLLYLGSKVDVLNKIIQALTQISDFNRDEVSDENVAQQLGVELIYYMQALSLVDKLMEYHKRSEKSITEDQDPVSYLHMLCTMTFTPLGHTAVVQVITYNNNIKAFIPFVKLTGDDRDDARLRKSVCAGYTAELMNMVVHHSDNVEFLKKHGEELLALGESEFSSKLSRLKEWLNPIKSFPSCSHDSLSVIIEQLKTYLDDVMKLPRGLITVLRVLKHLAIAPVNEYPDDKNEEMKYKYVLVELFSADCCPIFVTFLQKLSDLMLRPWQQGIPRSNEMLSLYLFTIRPCLEMVKAITQYLIMARGTEFRDLTTLPVLFELHTVLCSVPASSMFVMEINSIQKDIVDTLAAYTQPLSQPTEEKDKISQSLWTLTIRDLLKFTMKAPYAYLSGLQILSELLPLPLPLQTREPLSKEEESLALNTRKLWSAHLLPLHGALHNIIRTLSATSCQPLQQILRKICWQMSDLAAPTATMITQCILDILLEHIETVGEMSKVNPESDETKVALATRGRFLNLLAYLLSQPAIKSTMLRIMGPSGEEKYQGVLGKMLDILNLVSERQDHVQDQECIVSILQSLCDMEVTLTAGESTLSIQEQVANALPSGDQLQLIIEALLEHIAHPNHKYDTVLPCIRALVMLTDHDYSFYLLKDTFEKHKLCVYRLLQRIKFKFSKDSSDCLSTFSTTLEFLRLLVSTEPPDEDMAMTRTITLSNQELREVIAWTQDMSTHPLVDLQKLLEDGMKEEEALDSLVDSVNSLINVLRQDSPQKPKPDIAQPSLPEPQPLPALFNMRSVCTLTDPDDERLSSTFWQTTFEPDEPDLVPFDLDSMCQKYCKDFSLEDELKKDIGLVSEQELTKPKKLKDRRKSQEFVTWRGRGVRRPFVAPMRGRGIARGLAAQANRHHDNFRSRPPNTSRPPSMHVDDFMKLEQKSDQNRDSGDAESQTFRRDSDFSRGRGRGFERGRGFDRGRGRFITPPGSFRRDVGQRGGRDGESSVYRSKPTFVSPRFNGSHERTMSGDRRDSRGGRFESRGRGFRGNWASPRFKDDRFSSSSIGFRGRSDPNRHHSRSFTK